MFDVFVFQECTWLSATHSLLAEEKRGGVDRDERERERDRFTQEMAQRMVESNDSPWETEEQKLYRQTFFCYISMCKKKERIEEILICTREVCWGIKGFEPHVLFWGWGTQSEELPVTQWMH